MPPLNEVYVENPDKFSMEAMSRSIQQSQIFIFNILRLGFLNILLLLHVAIVKNLTFLLE